MLKRCITHAGKTPVLLMDSITKVTAQDEGSIIVSGSHGGVSSGEFALEFALSLVFFNNAGVGKDEAGILALSMLSEHDIPAGAVSHQTARIGDANDMWENGVISHLNSPTRALGLQHGMRLREAVSLLYDHGSANEME